MLGDRMARLMRKVMENKSEEYKLAYADGCLDMYNEACREYEEVFAEQNGGINEAR